MRSSHGNYLVLRDSDVNRATGNAAHTFPFAIVCYMRRISPLVHILDSLSSESGSLLANQARLSASSDVKNAHNITVYTYTRQSWLRIWFTSRQSSTSQRFFRCQESSCHCVDGYQDFFYRVFSDMYSSSLLFKKRWPFPFHMPHCLIGSGWIDEAKWLVSKSYYDQQEAVHTPTKRSCKSKRPCSISIPSQSDTSKSWRRTYCNSLLRPQSHLVKPPAPRY